MLEIVIIACAALIALCLAFYLGVLTRRKIGEAKISSAEAQAAKIIYGIIIK